MKPMAVISAMLLDLGFKVVIDGSRTLGFNVRIEADRGLRARRDARRGARPAVAIGAWRTPGTATNAAAAAADWRMRITAAAAAAAMISTVADTDTADADAATINNTD